MWGLSFDFWLCSATLSLQGFLSSVLLEHHMAPSFPIFCLGWGDLSGSTLGSQGTKAGAQHAYGGTQCPSELGVRASCLK